MLVGLGRYEEAIPALDRAIKLGPTNAMAQHNRGWILMQLGRYEQALTAFDEAISSEPADALAHYNWPAPVSGTRAYVSPGSYVPENGSRSASQIGVPY